MTRGKKNTAQEPDVVEIGAMDFDLALKILREDILPANSVGAEKMQEASTGYKAIKKQCHIQPGSIKDAVKVWKKEEAKRDDYLRGFCEAVNRLCGQTLVQFVSNDLVDRAISNVVPLGRVDGGLATLGGDEEFEATEEELAKQEGRKTSEPEPEPGTAAEALAAMKAAQAAEAAE